MNDKARASELIRLHIVARLENVLAGIEEGYMPTADYGVCHVLDEYLVELRHRGVFGVTAHGSHYGTSGTHVVQETICVFGDSYAYYSGEPLYPVEPPTALREEVARALHRPVDNVTAYTVFDCVQEGGLWTGEYGQRRMELMKWMKELYSDPEKVRPILDKTVFTHRYIG